MMEKMQFKISINAAREKVWNALFTDASYQEWTAVFAAGSRADTDWKKGSKALFVDTKNSGMVSVIEENIPNEFMSIKHLGSIKEGIEDLSSAESMGWAGALENYTLQTVDSATDLTIDLGSKGIPPEFIEYFQNTWPKALDKLKEIAERD